MKRSLLGPVECMGTKGKQMEYLVGGHGLKGEG